VGPRVGLDDMENIKMLHLQGMEPGTVTVLARDTAEEKGRAT
jgi:hypothetical protein